MGATSSTVGFVLRATPLRERDLVVQLFTEAHGRISAVARGVRGSKRRPMTALGLLVLGSYQVGPPTRGELWRLDSWSVVEEWVAIAGDVAALAHASYAVELVRELSPAEQVEPEVLPRWLELQRSLAERGASPSVLRRFELGLLGAVGSAPELERCISCGRDDLGSGVVFDPAGGVVCAECAAQRRGAGIRPMSAAARAYLVAVRAAATPAAAAALEASRDGADDRQLARDALQVMIVGLVGHPLRTVEFIDKMRGGAP